MQIDFLGETGVRPFTPVVRCRGFLFVSGQASTDEGGNIISDTFEGEFHRSVDNLLRLLKMAGSGPERIVQVRAYVHDPADLPLYNQLYRQRFAAPYPARTTLTGCLGVIRFEIECIAAVGEAGEGETA